MSDDDINQWNKLGTKDSIGSILSKFHEVGRSIYLLYADCANRISIERLKADYSRYCLELGISEQNMITMATAIANKGYPVVASAYATFITARVHDQIRANLGYIGAPVCLIGLSAGLAASDLGATHMALEDIANMRIIPGMNIWSPLDATELVKILEMYYQDPKPI